MAGAYQHTGQHNLPPGASRSATGSDTSGGPAQAYEHSGAHNLPPGASRSATGSETSGGPAQAYQHAGQHNLPAGATRQSAGFNTEEIQTPRRSAPLSAPSEVGVVIKSVSTNQVVFTITPGANTSSIEITFGSARLATVDATPAIPFDYTHNGGRGDDTFSFTPFNSEVRGPTHFVAVPSVAPAPTPTFTVRPLTDDSVYLESTDPDPDIAEVVVQISPVASRSLPPRIVVLTEVETPRPPLPYSLPPETDDDLPVTPPVPVYSAPRRSAVVSGLSSHPHRFRAASVSVQGAAGEFADITATPADNPLNRQELAAVELSLGVELTRISPYHTADTIEFEEAAVQLLPPGLNDNWESSNGRLARLLGCSMHNVNERLVRMVEELFPATASADSLSEQESLVFNTDDPNYQSPSGVDNRRNALIIRHRTESGATEEFFRNLLASHGVIGPSVSQSFPLRVDEGRVSVLATPSPDRVGSPYAVLSYDRDGTLTDETHAQMLTLLRALVPTNLPSYLPASPSTLAPKNYQLVVRDAPPNISPEPGTLVGVRDENGNFVNGKFIFFDTEYSLSSSGLVNTSSYLDNFIANGFSTAGTSASPIRVSVSIDGILTDIRIPIQGGGFLSNWGTGAQGPEVSVPYKQGVTKRGNVLI